MSDHSPRPWSRDTSKGAAVIVDANGDPILYGVHLRSYDHVTARKNKDRMVENLDRIVRLVNQEDERAPVDE